VCELNKDHPQAAELFNPDKLPALHDPFAGGGAIPLEAQRLGLEAYASDLNPVAVLINKAMIEIPPKFAGRPPVSLLLSRQGAKTKEFDLEREWPGATGLAEDVRYYGAWMREEAQKRIGHLYPPVEITEEMANERPDLKPLVGQKLTVIAWLWARTVKSPNPAFSHVDVPLTSTFILLSKPGKESYVEPIIDGDRYTFKTNIGRPPTDAEYGIKAKGHGANFHCIVSGVPISGDYIKAEAQAGRMGAKLMAVVAEGNKGRVYLSPTVEMESLATQVMPPWKPEIEFFQQALGFRIGNYGMTKWSDLFSARQLMTLTTLSGLVGEARETIFRDAITVGMPNDDILLDSGGIAAKAYAEAVSVYLACAISKGVNMWSSLCFWMNDRGAMRETMARQALSMVWDHAEANPFSSYGGNFLHFLEKAVMSIQFFPNSGTGFAVQADAQRQSISINKVVSTDPPYYDNIGYADLSDFFYTWLRPCLKTVYPALLSTIAVPKAEELVATPHRHGNRKNAGEFFLNGMTEAMRQLASQSHSALPLTIFYAFKQSETDNESETSSTYLPVTRDWCIFRNGLWPWQLADMNDMQEWQLNQQGTAQQEKC